MEFFNEINKAFGITWDPRTENYMMVLGDECKTCNYACNTICFQRYFDSWTSDNDDIDKLIQNTQLSTHDDASKALEWIPYDKFINIKYISKSEFGKEYSANWIDGKLEFWNNYSKEWKRIGQKMFVNLKSLNNSKNLTLKFVNEIKIDYEFYGITQDPKTKNYIMVLNNKCKECNKNCNAMYFQQKFGNWTSGNDNIDKLIQVIQLSVHDDASKAFEWIPYDKFVNIKYIAENKSYNANWIDGKVNCWNYYTQNWTRKDQNMFVNLKSLNNLNKLSLKSINMAKENYELYGITQNLETGNYMIVLNNKYNLRNISLNFTTEIKTGYKFHGITQDPGTKNFMLVLNKICKNCSSVCYTIRFQQNFDNWTSSNDNIDKFIQDAQLSVHYNLRKVLEWIPYDRFYMIKYIANTGVYKANWIDGHINHWNFNNQYWERTGQNMIVILKSLNNLKDILLNFTYEINKPCGFTQNPETKNYMMVLKYEYKWDNVSQNWKRYYQNIVIVLKILNDPKNISLEFMNEINKPCGITQDPKTKCYMMVLKYECKNCNDILCNAINFQLNFGNWTSGNDDIDKFIQDTQLLAHKPNEISHALEWIPYDRFYNIKCTTKGKIYKANWIDGSISNWNKYNKKWQRKNHNTPLILKSLNDLKIISLKFINEIKTNQEFYGITQDPNTKIYMMYTQLSAHDDASKALEWIPYDRFYDVKYIEENKFGKIYNANWTDGCIDKWDNKIQNWKRYNQNMYVNLKSMNDSLELMTEIDKPYGITQDPDTKKYVMVFLNNINSNTNICKKCNYMCNAVYFRQNFDNWTSGGFGEVYKANWIDGRINEWDNENKIWRRYDEDILVALKSLNHSKNITLEFMNEMILHHRVDLDYRIIKLYGITQHPETENYIMVMEYAVGGSLRKYLTTNYNKLNWNNKISYLDDVISGLKNIHEKELIHRDLHIGNILKLKNNTAITDMGLCKPVNHDAQKNTVYGILPYIAPEILQGRSYTKNADIYSFGIIMYEVISGLPPYYDVIHDENLAIKICQGLRPRFKIKVPQLIIQLIKRCLDADQQNRPTAEEIINILYNWQYDSEIFQAQIEEADEINKKSLKGRIPSTSLGLSYKTHSEAIYKSRSFNFNSLPKPKNSDDYYRYNDNIISVESSVALSLQIDVPQLNTELKNDNCDNMISIESSASLSISQLNINDNVLPEQKSSDDDFYKNDNMNNVESSASLSIDINNNLSEQKSSDGYYKNDNMINVESSASLSISQLNIINNNLPEPKNSDDYYKQNDNIISVESSESLSLQICISQLNINDLEPKNSDDY
ncbi:kinase-like domain-containing protein [Rhizophagus clarus]|uniref:Kinase-like domain-containing protein n=1 Tax=Rhizophagus clarus TaxID=94130 RepID=A0A8H3KUQ1_9GLOM|nr:kinase-like domain-containing protein [Rhizophagus clarus]